MQTKSDYDAKGAAMLLIREITQHDPNLIGSKEWNKIFNKAMAIKNEADKADKADKAVKAVNKLNGFSAHPDL